GEAEKARRLPNSSRLVQEQAHRLFLTQAVEYVLERRPLGLETAIERRSTQPQSAGDGVHADIAALERTQKRLFDTRSSGLWPLQLRQQRISGFGCSPSRCIEGLRHRHRHHGGV